MTAENVTMLQADDERARDFAGSIRLWNNEPKELELENVSAIECEMLDLVASPRGIGLAMATMVRAYIDLLPPELRQTVFSQVLFAFQHAWRTAVVINPEKPN